jgi:hypothetical protein
VRGCHWSYSVPFSGACFWVNLQLYILIPVLSFRSDNISSFCILLYQIYDWEAASQAGECKVHHCKSFCNVLLLAFALLSHHSSVLELFSSLQQENFPFLAEYSCSRSRTTFYYILGSLVFMEESPVKFRTFMEPLQRVRGWIF